MCLSLSRSATITDKISEAHRVLKMYDYLESER